LANCTVFGTILVSETSERELGGAEWRSRYSD